MALPIKPATDASVRPPSVDLNVTYYGPSGDCLQFARFLHERGISSGVEVGKDQGSVAFRVSGAKRDLSAIYTKLIELHDEAVRLGLAP